MRARTLGSDRPSVHVRCAPTKPLAHSLNRFQTATRAAGCPGLILEFGVGRYSDGWNDSVQGVTTACAPRSVGATRNQDALTEAFQPRDSEEDRSLEVPHG
jgi:hypothetical protein